MSKKVHLLYFGIIMAMLIGGGLYSVNLERRLPKIGYVRTADILEQYEGVLDAAAVYDEKKEAWQQNVEVRQQNFNEQVDRFNTSKESMSEEERMQQQNYLQKEHASLQNYIGTMQNKVKEEDAKLKEGAYNQINTYIKKYADENGYDMIFGVTLAWNIMYGAESVDLTDEILKGLNKEYKN